MTKHLETGEIGLICRMRAVGYTQEEIATELCVSQSTIAYHLQRLRRRVNEDGIDTVFRCYALYGRWRR